METEEGSGTNTVARVFSADPENEYFFAEGCYILELLNEPSDPEVSVARARVPPGVTTQWHRLLGTTERYVIQSGVGEVWLGKEGPLRVGPGDVVLIPATVPQRIRNPGPGDLLFLAICTPRFQARNYLEGAD